MTTAAEEPRAIVLTGRVNPRGIPEMVFIEDLEAMLASQKVSIEELLQSLQTMFKCVGAGATRSI